MAKVKRINVVFLYVLDIEGLRKFYEAAFDLGQPVVDAKWWVEYEIGDGSHLALHRFDPNHGAHASVGPGAVRFSVEVEDIQHYVERLKKLGAAFHYEPRKEYGFWLAEFDDPEGNAVRLLERVK
jgi:predicted enzyme related to lactoylglutathione lyase